MLTYPWKCTVFQFYSFNHLGNTWKPLVLMTWHFDYCPTASEGDNQSVKSSAPLISRCFPGGYNVKLYISRGRPAWWLLAFLHSAAGRCRLGLGLNPAGVEFQWQCRWRIWPMSLVMLSLWLACWGLSEQTQATTRLACSNGHEWLGNGCKQYSLSRKPGVAGLNCGGWQYNKRNFTLLTFVVQIWQSKVQKKLTTWLCKEPYFNWCDQFW